MAEFIEFLSKDALADLQKGNAELVTMIKNVDTIGQKMSKINTPSGSDSAIKGLTAEYQKQEKVIQSLQAKLEVAAQKQQANAEKTRLAEIRLSQAREKAFDNYSKQLSKEEVALAKAENLYNKVRIKVAEMTSAYNGLQIKQELGIKLTAREEAQLTLLTNRLTKYRGALNETNKKIGNYSMEVGNYAKGTSNLSNAIGQISRELPNFGQSLQIGIMSLTNNIGALIDGVKQVKLQNAELKAQGLATKSALSQVFSALLNWQTALFVGIGLLNAYGKEIGEWVTSLFDANSALNELSESQKKFNEARFEGKKDAVAEISELKKYLSVVKDRNISDEEREIALKKLRTEYPFYFKNLTDEQILLGKSEQAVNNLMIALEKRKEIEKKTEISNINKQKLLDIEKELDATKDLEKATLKQLELERAKPRIADRGAAQAQRTKELKLEEAYNNAKEKQITLSGQIAVFNKNIIKTDSDIFQLKKETIALEFQQEKERKKKKDKTEEERLAQLYINALKELELQLYVIDQTLNNDEVVYSERLLALELHRKKVLEIRVLQFNEEMRLAKGNYGKQKEALLNFHKESLEDMKDFADKKEVIEASKLKPIDIQARGIDAQKELAKGADEATDALNRQNQSWLNINASQEAYEQSIKDYLKSFQEEFMGNMGFPTLFAIMNGEIIGFGDNWAVTMTAMMEVAQEAFNFINQLQEQRFENAFNNLEREKEVAIAFAGESTTAREEIERQYEARRAQLERKKAQQQKQTAIFNIIIDTAQAVVGALAEQNYGGAILFAALGAAQLAIVSSQQIPEYWKGTDDAKEGLAWTQERGREIITDKHGKVKSLGSDKGATLTKLNKGDKVFNATDSAMMFNENLNSMLLSNGISSPKIEVNNSSALTDSQVNAIVGAIQSKESVSMNIDKSGLNVYVKNGHTTKQIMNDRFNFKGRSV